MENETTAVGEDIGRAELGGTPDRDSGGQKMGIERCKPAPQLYWNRSRDVALELHMDDIHVAATSKWTKTIHQRSNDRLRSKEVTGANEEALMSTSRG